MHEEFGVFLATQGIDKERWDALKSDEIEKADEVMDIFSDVVFEKALEKCQYVERIHATEIMTVRFDDAEAYMILVKVNDPTVDLLSQDWKDILPGLQATNKLEFFRGKKAYKTLREMEMFELMKQGAYMADETLYKALDQWVHKEDPKK